MTSNKYFHLTLAERQIIETGIFHGSTKAAIAKTLGKASNPSLSVIRLTVLYSPNAKTETLSSAISSALPISSSLVSAEIALQGPVTVVRSIHAVTMINTDTLLRRRTTSIVTALSVHGLASMQRFLRSRNSVF